MAGKGNGGTDSKELGRFNGKTKKHIHHSSRRYKIFKPITNTGSMVRNGPSSGYKLLNRWVSLSPQRGALKRVWRMYKLSFTMGCVALDCFEWSIIVPHKALRSSTWPRTKKKLPFGDVPMKPSAIETS